MQFLLRFLPMILPIEPQDQHQSIFRVPVTGSSTIVCVCVFLSKARADIAVESLVSEF